jgi:hypothetical protein
MPTNLSDAVPFPALQREKQRVAYLTRLDELYQLPHVYIFNAVKTSITLSPEQVPRASAEAAKPQITATLHIVPGPKDLPKAPIWTLHFGQPPKAFDPLDPRQIVSQNEQND